MTPVPPLPTPMPMGPPGEMEAAWIVLCFVLFGLFWLYVWLTWRSEQNG